MDREEITERKILISQILFMSNIPVHKAKIIGTLIEDLEKENQQLKERINKIEKHVSSLSSVGRGCEIYADVKREILKVVREDNK